MLVKARANHQHLVPEAAQRRDQFLDMHTLPVARLNAMAIQDAHVSAFRLALAPRRQRPAAERQCRDSNMSRDGDAPASTPAASPYPCQGENPLCRCGILSGNARISCRHLRRSLLPPLPPHRKSLASTCSPSSSQRRMRSAPRQARQPEPAALYARHPSRVLRWDTGGTQRHPRPAAVGDGVSSTIWRRMPPKASMPRHRCRLRCPVVSRSPDLSHVPISTTATLPALAAHLRPGT